MFSLTIPEYEIHMSNEPVAVVYFPTRKIRFYKIKPRGKYFILYKKEVKGIFEIDPQMAWYIGKTQCFSYHISNMKPFDPVIINEINQFAKKNKLTKIRKKDARHSSFLRSAFLRKGADSKAQAIDVYNKATIKQDQLNQAIENGRNQIKADIDKFNETQEEDEQFKLTEQEESFYLLNYLNSNGYLHKDEKENFEARVSSETLTFDDLVTELHNNEIITINQPMDENIQRILEDFGTQDPESIASHVDDLSRIDKGLKKMTSIPIKQFIPASVLLAILIGGAIAVVVIGSNFDRITGELDKIAPPFSIPGFGFINGAEIVSKALSFLNPF